MTRYAKNLIGDWETEQFEPLRQVAQDRYNLNWDKLTNDFNNLNEQLAQNFKNARINHNTAILDNSRNSFNRLKSVEQDLASRGLTGSGLMGTYNAMNTAQQGQENNAALEELMAANKANVEGRFEGLDQLYKGTENLAGNLGDELAGVTDAEGDNGRRYADLVADLSESAAARAAQYGTSKYEEELDDIYQLITINDILNSDETDDTEKYHELVGDALVTPEQAERILSSYNYNKVSKNIKDRQNRLNEINYYVDKNYRKMNNPMAWWADQFSIKPKQKKIDELNKDLSQYTYEDLKNIMGY